MVYVLVEYGECKEKIWEAARDGNKKTISRLLLQATAEDLQYEAKVVIIQYYIFFFYLVFVFPIFLIYVLIISAAT